MNRTEIKETPIDDEEDTEKTCPNCGMEQKEWTANKGRGFSVDREFFCCEGCAEGTGCTCRDS